MAANIDLIKKFYSAFKAKDRQTYLDLCDDGIEWTVLDGMPGGGTYVGKEEVFEKYFPNLFSNFKEFHATTREFLDAGDVTVVLGQYEMVSKKSGDSHTSQFAHVYTVKNGKIVLFRQYADTAKIRHAADN